jgi:hypothetical protein
MTEEALPLPAYVVKAMDFPALYYLDRSHPRPLDAVWINRGTDQHLRKSTIDMLLRTMFTESATPSVRKLHESSGLRTSFRSSRDRDRFAQAFGEACNQLKATRDSVLTRVFDDQESADRAIVGLCDIGVPEAAISLVWRASQYLQTDYKAEDGHSVAQVAGSMMGSGIAGALLGVGVLLVPGVGPVAVAGALTASAFGSIAGVSGIIGATGGAIAKMLSDHDVDGVSAGRYEQEIRKGKIFLSVDTKACGEFKVAAEEILRGASKQGLRP